MTRKSVLGGYCDYPDTKGCALTKEFCDDPANFRSSREMQGAPAMAHGGSCRWQDSIKETVLGRCETNNGCASDPNSCPEGNSGLGVWNWPDTECTVMNTSFGRCDYGMCAWSHDHCHEDNTWEAFDEGCTCDQVRVGACYRWINENTDREVFCAVSQEACDEKQSWISPHELKAAVGFDCYLCREEASSSSTNDSITSTIDNMETGSSTSNSEPAVDADIVTVEQPTSSSSTSSSSSLSTNSNNGNNTVVIVSAVVGTLVAVSIIGTVVWKVFKSKRAVKRAIDGGAFGIEEGPPTGAIQVSSKGFDGTTDDDNASVLSVEDL